MLEMHASMTIISLAVMGQQSTSMMSETLLAGSCLEDGYFLGKDRRLGQNHLETSPINLYKDTNEYIHFQRVWLALTLWGPELPTAN